MSRVTEAYRRFFDSETPPKPKRLTNQELGAFARQAALAERIIKREPPYGQCPCNGCTSKPRPWLRKLKTKHFQVAVSA